MINANTNTPPVWQRFEKRFAPGDSIPLAELAASDGGLPILHSSLINDVAGRTNTERFIDWDGRGCARVIRRFRDFETERR